MAQQLSAPFRAAAAAGSRASAAAADPAKVSPSLPFLLCSLSLTFFPTPPPEFSGLFRVGVRLAEGWDVFVRCVTSCVADTAPRFRLKLGFRESGNLGLGGQMLGFVSCLCAFSLVASYYNLFISVLEYGGYFYTY